MDENKKITVPTSWADVTLRMLDEIQEIQESKADIKTQELRLVSLMTGLKESEVKNMPMSDFNVVRSKIMAVLKDKPKPKYPTGKLEWGGIEFVVSYNPEHMTASQFLDVQTLIQNLNEFDKQTARMIACFLVPKGKIYGEGYEMEDIVDILWNNLSAEEAAGLSSFFWVSGSACVRAFLRYLTSQVRKNKSLTREERDQAMKNLKGIEALLRRIGPWR